MSWSVVGVLLVVAAGVFGVIQYFRRAASNGVALATRDQELELERTRIRQMEAAAAEERKARRARLREEAAAVSGVDDADRLLREVTGADDPNVN